MMLEDFIEDFILSSDFIKKVKILRPQITKNEFGTREILCQLCKSGGLHILVNDQILDDDNISPIDDEDYRLLILIEHSRFLITRMRELELAKFQISSEQSAILHTLIEKGGSATIQELADSTMRKYNSASTLINRMLKQELIVKKKMPPQKKYKIFISEKGKDIYKRMTLVAPKTAFAVLSPSEKRELTGSLQKLVDASRGMIGLDRKLPFLEQLEQY